MYKTLQCCHLLLLTELILDRTEANLSTKASVCLLISESRVKNDLSLGERNMIGTSGETRCYRKLNVENFSGNEHVRKWLKHCKSVSRTDVASTLILRYSLPGLSTRRKLKKLWQLKFENKGLIPRKKSLG